MKHRTVAIVMFENVEELDFAGPWEVFSYFKFQNPELCSIFTVSEKGREIRCAKGLRVIADHSFETAPQADVVIVPGGNGRKVEVDNPRMIAMLQRASERAEVMASVCTGAFLLERAGLLNGKRATTYWRSLDELRAKNSSITITPQRWVDEGRVVTASGVSSGIDMSLYLIGRLWSPSLARKVQNGIEYFPQPPYDDVAIPE
jgi:transcriptional regulator GlxA family with amidase domain